MEYQDKKTLSVESHQRLFSLKDKLETTQKKMAFLDLENTPSNRMLLSEVKASNAFALCNLYYVLDSLIND